VLQPVKFIAVFLVASALISCVKQEAESNPTISITAKDENFVPSDGGTLTFTVTTNQDSWKCDAGNVTWIKADISGNTLSLSVESNALYEPRSATVTVSASTATKSFRVTQAASIFEPFLDIDVKSVENVPAVSGTLTVNVSTNLDDWTYELGADWLSATKEMTKLTLSYAENKVDNERSAVVKLTGYKDGAEMVRNSFTVHQAEADIKYETEDLSANGTSNSYLISHRGPYTFKATVCGNGKTVTGLDSPKPLNPSSAKLVWQTSVGVINSVALEGNVIKFEAGKVIGNALIAALDESGTIIWSWHIWRPETTPYSIKGVDGSEIMNVNLGATTEDYQKLGCYGLLYQWGRKDPFPGSDRMSGGTTAIDNVPVYDLEGKVVDISYSSMYDTRSNNLAFSIANPTICIAGQAQQSVSGDWLVPSESNTALWGNPQGSVYDRQKGQYPNKGSKTYFDPCPVGWRVPHIQVMYHISSLGSLVWAVGDSEGVMTWQNLGGTAEFQAVDINKDGNLNLLDYQNGWWLYLDKSHDRYSFFPATSRYYGYWGQFMGSMVSYWGNYWTNSASLKEDGSDSYKGMALGFGIKEYGGENYSVTSTPTAQGCRNDGYSIRCIKE